ncbi:MAG: hypothetical protein U0359_15165 [Byssovorax sp.]
MTNPARPRPRRRLSRRSLGVLVACGATAAAGALLPAGGCSTATVTVPTRALERSGRSAFVCLGDPKGTVRPQLPLEQCTGALVTEIDQYVDTDGGAAAVVPHLYALVTQTTRGEVAVIDTTATQNSVLDEDPSIPGASFLPIGAQPIDIVSTPGGTATFVGVAEVGREGLFALPSAKIRPASSEGTGGAGGGAPIDRPPPEISSWPACRLPVAPGQMLLLSDPSNEAGAVRTSCDAPGYSTLPDGDPGLDLGQEKMGRQKLVVTLPDAGGLVVIDAQALLDRPAGSFDPCPVERWVPLSTDVPDVPLPPPPSGSACVNDVVQKSTVPLPQTSRPSGLSYAAGRLYVSDLDLPLIHVLELPTPCEPAEISPLLPTSREDPRRVVTTSHVAVSPSLTPNLKRYLYAIDADDGSAMVFDVSDDLPGKLPLTRAGHIAWDPFEPPDRIRYSAPAADLVIVERDVPVTDPATGVAVEGVRCDPSPTLRATCKDPTAQSCDVATAYRTSSTYDSGAGPRKLRGTFAMLALTSGRVAVIDIDDYDAPCRAPERYSPLYGCEPPLLVSGACKVDGDCASGQCSADGSSDPGFCSTTCETGGASNCKGGSVCTLEGDVCGLASSREASCNVVMPNTPRMGVYAAAEDGSGQHVPGLSIFPLLYDNNGSLVPADGSSPRMVATVPSDASTKVSLSISISGSGQAIDGEGRLVSDKGVETKDGESGFHHVLAMNLEDPRAQLVDQNWFVTYEGAVPGFDRKVATLFPQKGEITEVQDPNSRFCDAGVHSEKAVIELLGKSASDSETQLLADYVQITSFLIDQKANYWMEDADVCSFQSCQAVFGDSDTAQPGRDLRIVEAYEDHVEVTVRDEGRFFKMNKEGQFLDKSGNIATKDDEKVKATSDEIGALIHCCFPTQIAYTVRLGSQWAVRGDASGFLHHVIADPETGVCRDSCDPRLARKNGRLRMSSASATVKDGDDGAFINPMFRFAILDATAASFNRRDFQFRFTTIGSFVPLLVDLSTDSKTQITPVGMTYLPSTGDLAVTDGSINGLILVNLSSAAVTRQFF